MTRIVIGHTGNQPFKIPGDKTFVGHEHAIIEIDDYGRWTLTDNNSKNGVYVRDNDGNYERVYQTEITPTTVVRLGPENVHSYEFWAQRVVATDPKDYSSEFMTLKQTLRMFKETEDEVAKKAELYNWISSCSGVVASLIMILVMALGKDNDGVSNNSFVVRMMLMSAVPVAVKLVLPKPAKKLKALRERRAKVIRCPNCGAPLTDYDVNQGQCPRCKAC